LGNVIEIVRPWLNVRGRQAVHEAGRRKSPAISTRRCRDVERPGFLPKISVDPAVAAQGTRRVHARHSRHSEKQTKGHSNFRIAPMARRSHSLGEIDKVVG
jgi:hypothetical protein